MTRNVEMPKWLAVMANQARDREGWPNGKYPAVAIAARESVADYASDEDAYVSLLQLLIDEIERLQRIEAAARPVVEQTTAEAAYDLHDPLIAALEAAKAAGGEW